MRRIRRSAKIKAAAVLLLAFGVLYISPWGLSVQEIRQPSGEHEALALALLGKTIVIDAGHGGFDPGAIGVTGLLEKDVNLAVSRRVANLLRQVGAEVVETRTEDAALSETKREDIHRRVEIAEECDADLFITVQANSIPQEQWHGAQVFYAAGSSEGQGLSESIQQSMTEVLQNTERRAKSIENIYVVNSLAVPSIVVECGFLSNYEEEALLADSKYQQLVAYAIFLGIIEYYGNQPVSDLL
jgi:N-acetylmuramoyl-L-alanine amidase